MGMALVAVLLLFTQTEGCGTPYATVETVSFSADGSQIVAAKLTGRDAQVPMKRYVSDVVRTISSVNASNGNSGGILYRDFSPEIFGTASSFWMIGRNSVCCDPTSNKTLFYSTKTGVARTDGITLPLQHPATNIAISQSGRYLAVSGGYQLTVFDCHTNTIAMQAQTKDMPFLDASHLAFNENETQLISGGWAAVKFWEISTGVNSSTVLQDDESWGNSLVAASNNTLIVCSYEGIHRYDFTGKKIASLDDAIGNLCCVSADGKLLAVATDSSCVIYDLELNSKLNEITTRGATALSLSPTGNNLVVGDNDGYVTLFDTETGKLLWRITPSGRNRLPWGIPNLFLVAWALVAMYIYIMKSNHGLIGQSRNGFGQQSADPNGE